MSELILTDDIIANTYIELHRKDSESKESELWNTNEYQFAILQVEIADTQVIETPQHVVFGIDISGSMSDQCADGRTKMHHIIHTTKNIIDVFSKKENNSNITVEIYGFDDAIETIIAPTKCDETTRDKIHAEINTKMNPRNSTNIEIALKTANARLQPIKQRKTHIFMTDGQITAGETNVKKLEKYIDDSYPNIFIGFGNDHDAQLLQQLAKSINNSYYYIDHVETAGLAYGEICHTILYPALQDITITINNGEIYDFRTNTWNKELQIASLLGEAKKTYHLRTTTTPELLSAEISASTNDHQKMVDHVDVLPALKNEDSILLSNDLTKYFYRQRTQELLYGVQQCIKEQEQEDQDQDQDQEDQQDKKRKTVKEHYDKLKTFLKNMKNYMIANNVTDDEFMKNLCDDIGITLTALKTANKNLVAAYCTGRVLSNGTQGAYQPVLTPQKNNNRPPRINRQTNQLDEDYTPLTPVINRSNATQRQLDLMRSITGNDEAIDNILSPSINDNELVKNVFKFPVLTELSNEYVNIPSSLQSFASLI